MDIVKLSAVIITFNEERNIARCLESLQDIVDEIIVIDSLSTDKTEEICSKYHKVKFHKQEWLGYSEQKNFGNSLSSNDWILSIDADEEVSSKLKESILKLRQENVTCDNVFLMNRLTNYCGKWIRHCGWYPDSKIRIFNKNISKWEGQVHEKIIFSKDTTTIRLSGDLNHYSFYSVQQHWERSLKYNYLAAESAIKKGKHSNWFMVFFNPKWKFFRSYVLQLGFLDGYYGYVICKISAIGKMYKYQIMKDLSK